MSAARGNGRRSGRDLAFLASLVFFVLFAILFVVRLIAHVVSVLAIVGMVLVLVFAATGLWKRPGSAGGAA